MANQNVYSVGQVNSYIKNMFDNDFMLKYISVRGEISNCKYHTSGHIYFSLKDDVGIISCVMFAGNRKGLTFHLEEGHNVIVRGKISVYVKDGSYQMYADNIKLDGIGQLYQRYEALKAELEEMGMFADEYKQRVPLFSTKIGIVTAKTGAAIRDIIQISKRRNPYVQLILYPALVQGEGAAQSIVDGIRSLDLLKPDVIIVGRGGGSIEDLWAFNEEIVARAIFECSTPVISAVGHETDVTIADFVADMRAPTPSAAAELAVYEYDKLLDDIKNYKMSLDSLMIQNIKQKRNYCEQLKLRLRLLSPVNKFEQKKSDLNKMKEKLIMLIKNRLKAEKMRLNINASKLEALSPVKKLSAGYSYITVKDKALVSINQVEEDDLIKINVKDGIIDAAVISKEPAFAGSTESGNEE